MGRNVEIKQISCGRVNKEYYLEVMRRLSEAIHLKYTKLWQNQLRILRNNINAPAQTSIVVLEFFGQKQNRNHASTTVFTIFGPC